MRAIRCPRCRSAGPFTFVWHVAVTTEVDDQGEQVGSTDYANEYDVRRNCINCPDCGHSWRTVRGFDVRVDVR